MKTRIIVAVIAIPLLLAVVFFAPLWAMGLVVGVIAAGVAWELLRCAAPKLALRMRVYASLCALALPIGESLLFGREFAFAAMFILFLLMFCELLLSFRGEQPMDYATVALALFAGAVIPTLLGALVRLGEEGRGAVYVLLPFVAAFSSDSGAYFVGVAIGKHKLAPRLSPNKTIEGSAGGFICATLLMVLYGVILKACGYTVNLPVMAVYGFFGSLVCQLGDLSFSAIKRETGVKDYGTLIPGHGGMLDRFDSTIFTAPTLELLAILVPAIKMM
ncbi:MAG: phosphatidate cytidylyltransferase [Oscillospiraceae bacterium]